MSNEVAIIAGLSLFLTWSVTIAAVMAWLNRKFSELTEAIHTRLSVDDYRKERNVALGRMSTLEHWALRLGNSVSINFADVSMPDYRVHGSGDGEIL